MENGKIAKHMIDFHKKSLDNCFAMMVTLQNQAANIFNFFHHSPIMSEEGKKIMEQWTTAYKQGIDDLKKSMDEGYVKAEEFFNNHSMIMFQKQTEKMFHCFLNQANWMPQNVKTTMEKLASIHKNGCEAFKKYVEQNMQHADKCSSVSGKQKNIKKNK